MKRPNIRRAILLRTKTHETRMEQKATKLTKWDQKQKNGDVWRVMNCVWRVMICNWRVFDLYCFPRKIGGFVNGQIETKEITVGAAYGRESRFGRVVSRRSGQGAGEMSLSRGVNDYE